MGFDATVLAAVIRELQPLVGGRVNKVYQPSPYELALIVYAGREAHRLALSCHPQAARLHLSHLEPPNPPRPPAFCMLLRRRLEAGRVVAIAQEGRERLARIAIESLDELGNPVTYTLLAEVMGRNSNLVLVGPDGRVVDAARRVGEEQNPYREVWPGQPYVPPPPAGKADPARLTAAHLAARQGQAVQAWELVLAAADGLGPLVAREAAHRAGLLGAPAASLTPDQLEALAAAVRDLYAQVDAGQFAPCLLYGPDGSLKDFAALPMTHWPGRVDPAPSMCAALDRFFAARAEADRLGALQTSLRRTLDRELARVRKKVALQEAELAQAGDPERLRALGELITANLWQIPAGAAQVTVPDYYDPDLRPVTIDLNPALSPQENAQAYFRRYQKARSAREALARQLAASRAELAYLEELAGALAAAGSLPELEELRRELAAAGYLEDPDAPAASSAGAPQAGRAAAGGAAPGAGMGPADTDRPPAGMAAAPRGRAGARPLVLTSRDGLEIWVGRTSQQNDALTFRLAAPTDLWLHARGVPGAHVILRLPPGTEPPPGSLEEAAVLAAYFSKARGAVGVPVDYTLRKHVRKPAGARPGAVIYDHERTLYVTPDPDAHPILRRLP